MAVERTRASGTKMPVNRPKGLNGWPTCATRLARPRDRPARRSRGDAAQPSTQTPFAVFRPVRALDLGKRFRARAERLLDSLFPTLLMMTLFGGRSPRRNSRHTCPACHTALTRQPEPAFLSHSRGFVFHHLRI